IATGESGAPASANRADWLGDGRTAAGGGRDGAGSRSAHAPARALDESRDRRALVHLPAHRRVARVVVVAQVRRGRPTSTRSPSTTVGPGGRRRRGTATVDR